MSLRCAVCGSKKIQKETKYEGYNQKKGFLGIALFGSAGAVMGTSGNAVDYFHCVECGHTMNKTMDFNDSYDIEIALRDKDKTKLELLKEKYINIEWNKEEDKKNELETGAKLAEKIYDYYKTLDKSTVSRHEFFKSLMKISPKYDTDSLIEAEEILQKNGLLKINKDEKLYTFFKSSEEIDDNQNMLMIDDKVDELLSKINGSMNLENGAKKSFGDCRIYIDLFQIVKKSDRKLEKHILNELEEVIRNYNYSNDEVILEAAAKKVIDKAVHFVYLDRKEAEQGNTLYYISSEKEKERIRQERKLKKINPH